MANSRSGSRRLADHAGSWYPAEPKVLSDQLDSFLAAVPASIKLSQKVPDNVYIADKPKTSSTVSLPVSGARVIIAPHAGYSYSGPASAWAYQALDLSKAKRVFLLGPSHALYLPNCALTNHSQYETPLGSLAIDRDTVDELKATGKFQIMSTEADENEHSLEMHLPYICKMFSRVFKIANDYPPLVPILVGNLEREVEKSYGELLAPYLQDPTSVFIASSDFCHWGQRFRYRYYRPSNPSTSVQEGGGGYNLKSGGSSPKDPPIHGSIDRIDRMAMDAIEGGKHNEFLEDLENTGNTVCGRHPIGIIMAAIEFLKKEGKAKDGDGKFYFIRHEKSSEVKDASDSSVSYASAYAVI